MTSESELRIAEKCEHKTWTMWQVADRSKTPYVCVDCGIQVLRHEAHSLGGLRKAAKAIIAFEIQNWARLKAEAAKLPAEDDR